MKIAYSLTELIGHTPLLEVCNIERAEALKGRVLVKIEAFNPGGSIKDRAALAMIETADTIFSLPTLSMRKSAARWKNA